MNVLFCNRLNFQPGEGIDRIVFGPPSGPVRLYSHADDVRYRVAARKAVASG